MDDYSTLLDEISSFNTQPAQKTQKTNEVLSEDNLNEYILKRASTLVDMSIEAIEELKPYVVQGCNPDEIASLAEMINASSKAIEAVNKLNLLKKKFDNDVKLKELDYEKKKELSSLQNTSPSTVTNNNVFIASREEIFKKYITAELVSTNTDVQQNQDVVVE